MNCCTQKLYNPGLLDSPLFPIYVCMYCVSPYLLQLYRFLVWRLYTKSITTVQCICPSTYVNKILPTWVPTRWKLVIETCSDTVVDLSNTCTCTYVHCTQVQYGQSIFIDPQSLYVGWAQAVGISKKNWMKLFIFTAFPPEFHKPSFQVPQFCYRLEIVSKYSKLFTDPINVSLPQWINSP